MSDESEGVGMFFGGMFFAGAVIFLVLINTRPTLEEHELYRFCLIKNIPLEECLIPKKPYKLTP